ncbi:MAG: hypothetical protein NT069_23960 [Planctomycetota bacterium]|nr:hypothetical protein [Planctomycetota bacterium]
MMSLSSAALLRVVHWLSRGPDEQLAELRHLGCPDVIDELALQFYDQAVLADQLQSAGEITEEQLDVVRRIDEVLDAMSGEANADLWTAAALKTSPMWTRVRILASAFNKLNG